MIDINTIPIPDVSVVPEPTAEQIEKLFSDLVVLKENWQSLSHEKSSLIRVAVGFIRRCRDLEAQLGLADLAADSAQRVRCQLEAEVARLQRNERTEYTCNGCNTAIMEKESMFIDELGPSPRYWHPLCRVAQERDELKSEVAKLNRKANLLVGESGGLRREKQMLETEVERLRQSNERLEKAKDILDDSLGKENDRVNELSAEVERLRRCTECGGQRCRKCGSCQSSHNTDPFDSCPKKPESCFAMKGQK